jgi:hypothetical protein
MKKIERRKKKKQSRTYICDLHLRRQIVDLRNSAAKYDLYTSRYNLKIAPPVTPPPPRLYIINKKNANYFSRQENNPRIIAPLPRHFEKSRLTLPDLTS